MCPSRATRSSAASSRSRRDGDVGQRPQPLGDRSRQPLALGRGPVARVPRSHELALDVVGVAARGELGVAVQAPLELREPGAGGLERVVAEQPPQLLRGARAGERRLAAGVRRRLGVVVSAQAVAQVGGVDVALPECVGDPAAQRRKLGLELGCSAAAGADVGGLHAHRRQVALDRLQRPVALDRGPECRQAIGGRAVAREQPFELAASPRSGPR